MKEPIVLDLSPHRRGELRDNLFQFSHELDEELLIQCAYYPKAPGPSGTSACWECSFEKPNMKCKRAHILVDTRVEGPPVKRVRKKVSLSKEVMRKLMEMDLTEEEVVEWIAKKRREVR